MNEDRELGWEPVLRQDGEESQFNLLEPGDYDFEVREFERKRSANGKPMMVATLLVTNGRDRSLYKENLLLLESCEWKLSQFFRSIGLKKRGEEFKVDWDKAIGEKGRCRVKNRTYTDRNGNERETNQIDLFYDSVNVSPKKQSNEPEFDDFSW